MRSRSAPGTQVTPSARPTLSAASSSPRTGSRALLVLSAGHSEPLVFPARVEAEARLDSTIDFWRRLGRDPLLRRPLARCRHSQRLGAEALGLRTIRRDRRRRHDLAARDARRRAQLGLPLLLAPRLRLHARCLPLARLFAGSRRLLLLAAARVSTHPSPPPGPLPPRRWHAHAGACAAARRLSRIAAGQGGQCRRTAAAARRLRRAAPDRAPLRDERQAASTARPAAGSARLQTTSAACGAEPDAGIWEVRAEPAHFTQSKLMCWVALDCAAELAQEGQLPDAHADRWKATAEEIREFVDSRCWSPERIATCAHRGLEN